MNLSAESMVVADGGEDVGALVAVGFDPATNQVVDLVVAADVPIASYCVIPVNLALRAMPGEVIVSRSAIRCCELSLLVEHDQKAASLRAASSAGSQLNFGRTVSCLDGEAGVLVGVLCDGYTYEISELIVECNVPDRRAVGVPMSWVRRIQGDRIVLSSQRGEVISMPPAPEDL